MTRLQAVVCHSRCVDVDRGCVHNTSLKLFSWGRPAAVVTGCSHQARSGLRR